MHFTLSVQFFAVTMYHKIVFILFAYLGVGLCCDARNYGNGATVCVCSKNNCDDVNPVHPLKSNEYEIYTSSKNGSRFQRSVGKFEHANHTRLENTIRIIQDETYQSIFGFGGAFTDATGVNILSLSNETQKTLLRQYFSNYGIQYSMGRIPLAGTDFSLRAYTYDDHNDDFELRHWSLQREDYEFKIPIIRKSIDMTNGDIKFFGSAWTAPKWMKTNRNFTGIGFLDLSMYDLWAQYHMKFIDAYTKEGVPIWGLTTGNEPADGFVQSIPINDMAWIPDLHAQWIRENLGPMLRVSEYSDVKIMILDDQRVYFPWLVRYILNDEVTRTYVDGSAVHYYTDKYVSADVLTVTHYDFPDKFIFASEACEGSGSSRPVILGSWERAENYATSIIEDLNNWATGFMDWNMALNTEGGPTFEKNYVDSPIIVNKTSDEFYKQPMFYAMGHFSKFMRPESKRVRHFNGAVNLSVVSFKRPDGGIATAIFNPTENSVPITVVDERSKRQASLHIDPRSINTMLYW